MTGTDKILLFSYGTLQLESVQLTSFGRRLTGQRDAMPGFKKTFVEITDPDVLAKSGERFHPIVSPTDDPNESVEGTVFEITADELAAADRYEVSRPDDSPAMVTPRLLQRSRKRHSHPSQSYPGRE